METIKLTNSERLILSSYQLMLDGLAEYLGPGYEIVLHSLEDMEHSVIKVINGHYSGRAEGAPLTDLASNLLGKIRSGEEYQTGMVYFNKNADGAAIKSATIPIFGKNQRVIGLLCINFYLDIPLRSFIDTFTKVKNPEANSTETFAASFEERVRQAVETARLQTMNNSSIPAAKKHREIISALYSQDIFQTKNAAKIVSELLGISKNTVYMHLRSLKQEEK